MSQEPGWRSLLGTFNWHDVHSEVAAEGRGRIALAGLAGVAKSSLYNRMMGWKALDRRPPEADMGAFTLVDLPTGTDGTLIDSLSQVDVILFAMKAETGLRPDEFAWFSRLRGTGVPVLPLLISRGPGAPRQLPVISQRLGTPVMSLSLDEPCLAERLCQRLLVVCPALAIPLGQHFRGVRRDVARRVILQTAAMTGIVGLEPVPMLDAPLQLAAQGGMVLRIGAIYGHPTGRGWPPELLGSTVVGVLLRLGAQQVVNWVPVAGWAVAGLITAAGTWLLVQAAVKYFEADRGSDWLIAAHEQRAQLRSRLLGLRRVNGRSPTRNPERHPSPMERAGESGGRQTLLARLRRSVDAVVSKLKRSELTIAGESPDGDQLTTDLEVEEVYLALDEIKLQE